MVLPRLLLSCLLLDLSAAAAAGQINTTDTRDGKRLLMLDIANSAAGENQGQLVLVRHFFRGLAPRSQVKP